MIALPINQKQSFLLHTNQQYWPGKTLSRQRALNVLNWDELYLQQKAKLGPSSNDADLVLQLINPAHKRLSLIRLLHYLHNSYIRMPDTQKQRSLPCFLRQHYRHSRSIISHLRLKTTIESNKVM